MASSEIEATPRARVTSTSEKALRFTSGESAPIDLEVAAYGAELNRNDVGTVDVNNPSMSRSQPDLYDATQVVCSIDLGFAPGCETERFMKRVALCDKWINRLIFRAMDIVAANSILIIQRRGVARVGKVWPRID